ncbi:4'-phosphopantetheinyl transferase superfamily protein [Bacteroides sp. 51]|uniref:4'-phosphopantetheinyl transferase family protein n=1 Tax=Bacteroides sp. 51 TaxID=2302938 RepID=UPI0013D0704C|nr:4'-phosphopantetheinyl transferase superfamily protein [Bacteroides sp. 51]NDV81845.1 siderophore biosynthesis protein [Bacteroides sp. 51]
MLYKQYITSEYQWGIWKVTENLSELLALLPDQGAVYMDELNAFKSDSRKIEWLAVRVLLYTLTQRITPIQYHPSGKPYFADHSAHLSISHTKGYVSVIISETNEVGIDIEKISERVHKVAHKFVRDDEHLPEDSVQKTHALLLIWSAKEVMFKCMNEEAVDFREHMHVDLTQLDGTCFPGKETRSKHGRTYLICYIIDPEFVMTWTSVES